MNDIGWQELFDQRIAPQAPAFRHGECQEYEKEDSYKVTCKREQQQ